MSNVDKAGSVFALGLRVARLSNTGTTPAAASGMYATDALVKVDFSLAYEDGEEYKRTNGAGKTCLFYKAPDTVKELTIDSVEICSTDPELEELLGGGSILTTTINSTVTTVGLQAPAVGTDPMPNGISLEAWSAAIVNDSYATTLPYIRWVFPRVFLRQGSKSLQADALGPVFEGRGNENPNWGNGPTNDWTYASDRVYQWARVAALPTFALGYQAIPTQTP